MSAAPVGFAVAFAAAALYGALLAARPPDWRRTAVKASFAGVLAIVARAQDAPPLLGLALALSALADGALAATAPERPRPGARLALMLSRLAWIALFGEIGAPALLTREPWRGAAAAVALGAALLLAARLRPGPERAGATAGLVVSALVAATALTLPPGFSAATAGGLALFAADAWDEARPADDARPWPARGRWALYAAALLAIAWSFLRPWP